MQNLSTVCELPPSYHSGETDRINRAQVGVLYYPQLTHWGELQHMTDAYGRLEVKEQHSGFERKYIDVRTSSNEVAGVGCLQYGNDEGELSCLAVLPTHRGIGIGKWLVAERIRRANELGLQVLYVERLAATNNLGSFYEELGFSDYAGGDIPSLFEPKPSYRQMPALVLRLQR